MLSGKRILLGVCGSIAAYKSAYLTRLLIQEGAEVQVVMTKDATSIITPLTLSTLSKKAVVSNFATEDDQWNNHITLGAWADLFLIAPASANTIAKMAHGLCDNLLTTVYLSARCPIAIAPAMDVDMWRHISTQRNLSQLQEDHVHIIPVAKGELASGLYGEGRMAEPEDIISTLQEHDFQSASSGSLQGMTFLVTAGPTIEPIDPVRFISNYSSGKMGIALADEIAEQGGKVILLKGPTNVQPTHNNVQTISFQTAEELYQTSLEYLPQSDVAIAAAAVADYTPAHAAKEKIKKDNSDLTLDLQKTQDILQEWGKRKTDQQLLVGFALETSNELENARKKLTEKNLDMIVLNSLQDQGAGFNSDTNKITILDKHNNILTFELKPKKNVAKDIIAQICRHLDA